MQPRRSGTRKGWPRFWFHGVGILTKGSRYVMLKKLFIALLAAAICLSFAGCSAGSKEYAAVKKCQEAVRELQSGRIIVTSKTTTKKTDVVVTEFAYKLTPTGTYEYCQTQFDGNNKAIYCEYSDGEKAEQWLIGSGWCVIDPTVYTKNNPHRYIKLISTVFDQKSVSSITLTEENGKKCYTILLKPEVLNETIYKDSDTEVKEETVTINTDGDDQIIYYADSSSMYDKANQVQKEFTLEMEISGQNEINEIIKPELRDYSAMPAK